MLFFIFVPMKLIKKRICILFVALSLSVIIADCGVYGSVFSGTHTSAPMQCNDFANNLESSQGDCCEDDIVPQDICDRTNYAFSGKEFLKLVNFSFKNNFISAVWQPPKHS
ncbi:MAG: hypothetical protein WCQ95_04505 [Bacteroidota bacterium]